MVKASKSLFASMTANQALEALSRVADPDIVLRNLGYGREVLRKLETDDDISGALETRREAFIGTPWHLEPSDSEPAEFVERELMLVMDPLLRDIWQAVPYGYAVQEIVYRKVEGRIGIARVVEGPIEWFEPRRDGTLWMHQGGVQQAVELDLRFFLTRRNPTFRNPYGEAILSRLYWPWFFRVNGWRFWMQYLERFADPLLMGQVSNPDAFIQTMKLQGFESIVAVESPDTVSSLTASASGEFEKIDAALTKRIAKLILGQTLTSDVGDGGSYAAAKVHSSVLESKRQADIRMAASTLQSIVNALWRLNRFAGDPPTFVMQDGAGIEMDRAERDVKLIDAGAIKLTEQYLLDRYDYDEGDFELGDGKPKEADPNEEPEAEEGDEEADEKKLPFGAALMMPARFTEDQMMVESLIDAAVNRGRSPIQASAIQKAIKAAESPDDLAERLAVLYRGDDRREFQDLLERALFAADVMGYVTAKQGVGQ